jgi:Ca-activated chloride channel family protein
MKQYILIILMFLCSPVLFAQDVNSYIHKGNELYKEKKYKDAEVDYRKSVEKKKQSVAGNFNWGDALYKEKKFGDAQQHFTDIASAAKDSKIKADAYHNLGNSLMETKKYDESINAYKKSLLSDPKDEQTRYNLAYAEEMLKKQQQQNKQNQDKNKQNQDQKNKQNQANGNPDKNQKGNPDKNQQDKNQQQNQKGQQQPNSLSKDDAQRMLNALNDQEKATQDKLKNKKVQGSKVRVEKDW